LAEWRSGTVGGREIIYNINRIIIGIFLSLDSSAFRGDVIFFGSRLTVTGKEPTAGAIFLSTAIL
jgi:hypothetical protein